MPGLQEGVDVERAQRDPRERLGLDLRKVKQSDLAS